VPTYEYKCDACGHTFEKFQSIKADSLKKCPECSKQKLRRLIGVGGGFIFKGSGFYITDYRDSAYKDKAKAEAGNDGKSENEDGKPAESKAESKSDSSAASAETKSAKSEAAAGSAGSTTSPQAGSTSSPQPSSPRASSGKSDASGGKSKGQKK
jgi:putative FmdB family regulatory protein